MAEAQYPLAIDRKIGLTTENSSSIASESHRFCEQEIFAMREAALEIARQSNRFAPSLADQLIDALVKPMKHLAEAYALERLKAQLRRLDDYQLNDIGLTRDTLDELTRDSIGPRGAIGRMRTDLRLGRPLAGIGSLRREAASCGWICSPR